ncbi:unnamed protein product [Linum tenue]|uniref:DUF3598 domain-containing protein n=1 Tax=Linum tenue TaxID=586396 RepID=A0AAV0HNM3_9ROSI|nr:unnamed protein product [Linum tenue]
MASSSALSFLPLTQSPKLSARNPLPNSHSWRPRPPRPNAPSSSYISASIGDGPNATEPITVETLHRFFELSVGKWHGSFYQFNAHGKLMQRVSTRLSASTYGEDDLMSLIQTLYIKQPPLSVSDPDEDPEWAEYKIKETNMFTVDRYQQIGFFPDTRAFALRYQTAGMLETVLRQGVLGENDTGEESPRNLKLPSRRPSIVCENCLYSQDIDSRRARAFHVMNPGGDLDMLLVFLEDRGDGNHPPPSLGNLGQTAGRVEPFLGRWEGHSMTKRSGVYGSTLTEADSVSLLEMNDKGQLIQDMTSNARANNVATKVHWSGTLVDNLIIYDGGYQITLLPGGMYMGCPCDIAKSVAESKSFHLEFCWLESPGKRQRLVRTYDVEGLAVSSTYFSETKV